MLFVRKSPWPKSPTSNLTVRRSLILVFYSSLLSSHKGTPSKFHWPRHLNSSSHLPSQVTQRESSSLETRTSMSNFAGEMGILRSICSCCTERRECSERLETRIWFIRNCTHGRVPDDAWFCVRYRFEQQTFPCDVSGPFDFQQNSGWGTWRRD